MLIRSQHNKVMVGSFRNRTWTEVCLPFCDGRVKLGPVLNELLHWLVIGCRYQLSSQYTIFLVVSFNQRTNEFVEVPMQQGMNDNLVPSLGVLDGCLSLTLWTHWGRFDETEVEVFVMKKYGDQASWTSLFVISDIVGRLSTWRNWVPLCFTKNAEVLMLLERTLAREIVVHNHEFCRGIPIPTTYDIKAATFVESIVSPPNNWEEEEEEEYTEIFLSGVTRKWKREQGDVVAFKVIYS